MSRHKLSMNLIKSIHQTQDEYGLIDVFDDGERRILSFAINDEQSCCLTAVPHQLQYEYAQAMCLVLLFCQPKRILVLGLGGGSLVTALQHCIPGIRITAVELRAAVIDLAYRYFQLPRSKRVQIIHQSADVFLDQNDSPRVDIVFADLYHSEGVDEVQLRHDFIQRCAAQLKDDGWLVLNCWQEHQHDDILRGALHTYFSDVRGVLTGSKNWIVLAGKQRDQQASSALKQQAERWSQQLGFSLLKLLARLQALPL